jgi:hypothetical protein
MAADGRPSTPSLDARGTVCSWFLVRSQATKRFIKGDGSLARTVAGGSKTLLRPPRSYGDSAGTNQAIAPWDRVALWRCSRKGSVRNTDGFGHGQHDGGKHHVSQLFIGREAAKAVAARDSFWKKSLFPTAQVFRQVGAYCLKSHAKSSRGTSPGGYIKIALTFF